MEYASKLNYGFKFQIFAQDPQIIQAITRGKRIYNIPTTPQILNSIGANISEASAA